MGGTRTPRGEGAASQAPSGLLGGDGGGRGGDGEDPDAAGAAAAAGGEGRGEAERDVVEAERHPGGHWGAARSAAKEPGAAAAAAAAAARGREIGMWVVVVASASGTNGGTRDGVPRVRSPPQVWPFGFCRRLAWMPLGTGAVFMSLSTPGMTVSPLRFHSHLLLYSFLSFLRLGAR